MKTDILAVLILAFSNVRSIHVGSISNTTFIASNISAIFANMTCTQCICAALMASAVAWNCMTVNSTCNLISNYSSNDLGLIQMDHATFFFRQQPSETLTTEMNSSLTSTSTTSISMTSSATNTVPPLSYIYWSLDSNYNDFYNVYNGAGVNSPSFVTPGYNGRGAALSLTAASSQYVLISRYMNMTYTSFTWEIWGYPTTFGSTDCLIVGMCETASPDRCLHLMVRQSATYLSFYSDDCANFSSSVPTNQWHHFAFVYDYSVFTQYIYLNGVLTCTHSPAGPFLGHSGSLLIGAINKTGTPGYFWSGYLDQISYVSRAKTANEILADATLVAYYSFDNGSFDDFGPNGINGTGVNLTSVAGRINQGISMTAFGEYFSASGMTLLGASYRSYSISLWINQYSTGLGSGTIIHLSANTGLWCLPILGLSVANQVIAQNWNNTNPVSVTGPILSVGVWTHVVTSYSAPNGVRLWINGTLFGSSGPFSYTPSSLRNTVALGNSLLGPTTCASSPVVRGQFYGMMDELRIYARELNTTEIYALANP